ncbi:MAG: glycosyltransferase family 4 protein [Methylocystis sp.]|uniref:glycosyltransferase family 4 protein n=1 Tax=Methylocystis sp. TaxID=1911079 RepID=UPI003DA2B475
MHGPLPQAKVCWLATEEDDPPERAASFSGPPVALILARIDASEGMKGHDELIDRWASVISVVPGARLVIAGGGSGLASIKRMAGDSGAAHAIDVLGFVEAARIPGLLERAHVLAMPSRQEGFGVAYIEAMRFGLPCIASRHDGGQEVNLDGETGYNVNLGRRDDLTERLIELLSNPARAQEMGQRGHARWRAHFRYSQFSARFQQNWRDFMSQTETGHGA